MLQDQIKIWSVGSFKVCFECSCSLFLIAAIQGVMFPQGGGGWGTTI